MSSRENAAAAAGITTSTDSPPSTESSEPGSRVSKRYQIEAPNAVYEVRIEVIERDTLPPLYEAFVTQFQTVDGEIRSNVPPYRMRRYITEGTCYREAFRQILELESISDYDIH